MILVAILVAITGCSSSVSSASPAPSRESSAPSPRTAFPPTPTTPDGPLEPAVSAALDGLVASILAGYFDDEALQTIAGSQDARLGWFVSDLLRFVQGGARQDALVAAFEGLTAVDWRWLSWGGVLIDDRPMATGDRARAAAFPRSTTRS